MIENKNPQEEKTKLLKKALTDAGFKKALLANPNAAIEKELGVKLPAGIKTYDVFTRVWACASRKNGKLGDGRCRLLKLYIARHAITVSHLRYRLSLRVDAYRKHFPCRAVRDVAFRRMNLLHFCADERSLGSCAVGRDCGLGPRVSAAEQ